VPSVRRAVACRRADSGDLISYQNNGKGRAMITGTLGETWEDIPVLA